MIRSWWRRAVHLRARAVVISRCLIWAHDGPLQYTKAKTAAANNPPLKHAVCRIEGGSSSKMGQTTSNKNTAIATPRATVTMRLSIERQGRALSHRAKHHQMGPVAGQS